MVFPSDLVYFLTLEVTVLAVLVLVAAKLLPPRLRGWGTKALWLAFFAKLAFPFGLAPLGQIHPTPASTGPSIPMPSGFSGITLGPVLQGLPADRPLLSFADQPFALLAVISAVLVAALVTRMAWAARQVHRLPLLRSETLETEVARLADEVGLKGPIELRSLPAGRSAASWGLVRRVILLPEDWQNALGSEDWEQILLHELVHLKNRDSWVCLLGQLLVGVYWFHPLVWIAHRRLTEAVETACDQRVLNLRSGTNRRAYGTALLKAIEQLGTAGPVPGTRGAARNRGELRRRILLIQAYRPVPAGGRALALLGLGALALVCLSFVPPVALEDSRSPVLRDNIDLLFADDPSVLGTWKAVDFVDAPAAFEASRAAWPSDLYVNRIRFFPGGAFGMESREPGGELTGLSPVSWFAWTKGVLIHRGDSTAASYRLETRADRTFLFLEWKNGDYAVGHQRPHYYVFERV